jgi:hypothetical protein
MTNIESEFYYTISYQDYGHSKTLLMNVYERRKFLWRYRYHVIDGRILFGERYGKTDAMALAKEKVHLYLSTKAQAKDLPSGYVKVEP